MKISSINNHSSLMRGAQVKRQSFGDGYVTTSKVNLADVIGKTVDTYNKGDFAQMYDESRKTAEAVIKNVNKTLPNSTGRISSVDDLYGKTDIYILAGGAGSRFVPMATSVAKLRANGEKFNKISTPYELGNGQAPLTMLDIPMAMGRFFVPETGYKKITAEKPTGSFGDPIFNYLDTGREPRDVVVCCGDNVFDMKSEKMLDYIVRTINNPDKQLGVVGVARTPDEVAKRFGVLAVGEEDKASNTYPLLGFVEKPALDVAKKLVTADGVNAANTGMFVIKKDSMEKLLDIIRYERKVLGGKTTYIAKDDKEIFDFANATKWTRNVNGSDASDVMMVDVWEDVGEPAAYLNWVKQLKQGHYLDNFTPERKNAILEATKHRVGDTSIQFSVDPKGEEIVDGISIIA